MVPFERKQSSTDRRKEITTSGAGVGYGVARTSQEQISEKARAMEELRLVVERLAALGGGSEEILDQVTKQLRVVEFAKKNTNPTERSAREQQVTEEEFKAFFYEHLKRKKIVQEEAGRTIIDTEKLKTISLAGLGFSNDAGAINSRIQKRYEPFLEAGLYEILGKTFEKKKVLSQEVWERVKRTGEHLEGVDLLYRPTSVAAALDPVRIKQSKFLLGPWELRGARRQWLDEQRFPDGTLTLEELSIAGMIYHPSCGDGIRDGKGRLTVKKDPDSEERKPLSGSWFFEHGVYGKQGSTSEISLHVPTQWVKAHPKLTKTILKIEDFTKLSVRVSDERIGVNHTRYVEKVRTTGVGNVMFNGISHHVGREFKDRTDVIFANIGPTLGLCSERAEDGTLRPLFTFRVFQKTDPEIRDRVQASKFLSVGLKEIEKQPVSIEQLNGQIDSGRLQAIRDYLAYKNPRKTEKIIDERGQLSPGSLVALHRWLGMFQMSTVKLFETFVSQNGETAARFLLLFQESDKDDLLDFCKRSEQLGKPIIEAIMQRCLAMQTHDEGQVKDLARAVLGEASEQQAVFEDSLKLELQRRWRRILDHIIQDKHPTFEGLQVRLAGLEKDNALFASMVRVLCKGKNEQAAIELLKGVTFDANVFPKEIDPRTKKEMGEIFDANWVDQDRIAGKAFKKSLEQALNPTNEQTRFFLLKKDGETIAYIRFDDRPDLGQDAVYGGSLNVHPAFRQSGIGEVLMQKTIDRVAQEKVIYAHVVPDAVVGTAYVEQMHCVITGVEVKKDADTGKETSILRLRRDDKRVYRSRQTRTNWEALKSGTVPGVEVRQFDLATQKEGFLTAIKQAAIEGKVVTRYTADHARPMVRWIVLEREVSPTVGEPGSTTR